MGEGEPQPPRQFSDLSLSERFDALMAVALENPSPSRELIAEWIGTPSDVPPQELPRRIDALIEQRARQREQLQREGKPLPKPEETFQRLHIDPRIAHGRIAETALAKIPGFFTRPAK